MVGMPPRSQFIYPPNPYWPYLGADAQHIRHALERASKAGSLLLFDFAFAHIQAVAQGYLESAELGVGVKGEREALREMWRSCDADFIKAAHRIQPMWWLSIIARVPNPPGAAQVYAAVSGRDGTLNDNGLRQYKNELCIAAKRRLEAIGKSGRRKRPGPRGSVLVGWFASELAVTYRAATGCKATASPNRSGLYSGRFLTFVKVCLDPLQKMRGAPSLPEHKIGYAFRNYRDNKTNRPAA